MRKSLFALTSLSLLLVGCATGAALLNNAPPGLSAFNALRSSVPLLTPEKDVDPERLRALAAILTGQQKMPDGRLIPERGTVEGRNLTRAFLSETLQSYGYTPETHTYRTNGTNVLTKLMAPSPTDEYILIGAHMDSVRNAGADDNNSGTVAVLEAARLLKQVPDRKVNLIFAWFDEEELGLIGSYALARDLKKQGLKVLSVHTLDMVGWDGDQDNVIEVEQPDGNLWEHYQQVNKTHGLNLPLSRTSSGDTDHVAFRREGFTSVGLCEEWVGGDTTPHYHRRTDAINTLNFTYLSNVTRLTIASLSDLSRKAPGPLVSTRVPHNRFPGRARPFHRSYEGLPLE
ncbi:MAG: M28 family metallopeptidase [Candidatus Sericytochromatia bacterium]